MDCINYFLHGRETSVLLIINTPFQALCAIEAIKKYNIFDYKVLVPYFHNESRTAQIYSILDLYNISYTSFLINKRNTISYIIKVIFALKKYSLAFIGDFYTILSSLFAVLSLKYRGKLIYMDDGNSTIDIFKDKLAPAKNKKSFKIMRKCVCCIALLKKVEAEKYFFSIFPDIPNHKYIVISNDFSNITPANINNSNPISLFIGTVTPIFCKENNISEDAYYVILDYFLRIAKEKSPELTYIPHGLDKDIEVKAICEKNGVQYCSIDICVELYILHNNLHPKYLYGFSSSALYSVKRLFPDTIVYNVRIISDHPSIEYEDIANYYALHGINNIIYEI